jgi:hypothetical protein
MRHRRPHGGHRLGGVHVACWWDIPLVTPDSCLELRRGRRRPASNCPVQHRFAARDDELGVR